MLRTTALALLVTIPFPLLAQQPPPPPGSGWSEAIRELIFADPVEGTLRPPDEIAAGWPHLSPEDRALVRSDCEASKAADEREAAATETTGDQPTEAAGEDLAAVSLSHLVQVCRAVEGL